MIVSQCKTTFKSEPIFWSNSNKAFPKKIKKKNKKKKRKEKENKFLVKQSISKENKMKNSMKFLFIFFH